MPAQQATVQVQGLHGGRRLKAIKSLRPGAWFLENPRAKLRELCAPLLEKYFPRHILYTVSCMFC